jgi:hypothetical protein
MAIRRLLTTQRSITPQQAISLAHHHHYARSPSFWRVACILAGEADRLLRALWEAGVGANEADDREVATALMATSPPGRGCGGGEAVLLICNDVP